MLTLPYRYWTHETVSHCLIIDYKLREFIIITKLSNNQMNSIEILQPDDFHHHLRDGNVLENVISHACRNFHYIICMPNLKPPIVTTLEALKYRNQILSFVPEEKRSHFIPLMTLYLTDMTTIEELSTAKESGFIYSCKLYPAGATTNSEHGVTCIEKIFPLLQHMADIGLILCIHGEVVDSNVDMFDREKVFIQQILNPILQNIPQLKVIMEHITTEDAVNFIMNHPSNNLAATITAHHLLYNRNDLFKGGICPHMYCLPVLKRERHRQALLMAATSNSPRFFAGTDSAPHTIESKESSCGCAGIFTAHAAIELYTEAFDQYNALDKLEDFLSIKGSQFYGLTSNDRKKIRLVRKEWQVPKTYPFGNSFVVPLRANQTIAWSIEE